MTRLRDRRAIITGGASGIGRATVELFSNEGAKVIAVDRPNADFAGLPKTVIPVRHDLTSEDAPESIVSKAVEELGGIDILFNNAGIAPFIAAKDTTDDEWDDLMAINLRAVFRLSRAAIPFISKSKFGRIISTSSVAAIRANSGLLAYSASKAGVIGLTQVLAAELGEFGVTVNAILPGPIKTPLTADVLERPDLVEFWSNKASLRRIGHPIDIARVALFFASDEAAYVTGQALVADGGTSIRV
jgi:NAD(P)-dependent dehydrogenase (short-subunit alcohol dehydrogenase family)